MALMVGISTTTSLRRRRNRDAVAAYVIHCADLFGISAKGIRVEWADDSPTDPTGDVRAWAEPDRIVLGPEILSDRVWRWSDLGKRVVGHEVAHVAQFRASAPTRAVGPLAADVEADAHRAALAALAGHPYRCRVAIPTRSRWFWNRLGHYYTVAYCAHAAGLSGPTAHRLAVLSGLVDQCHEFDAVTAAVVFIRISERMGNNMPALSYIAGRATGVDAAKSERLYLSLNGNDDARTLLYCMNVSGGLHCFNSESSLVWQRNMYSFLNKRKLDDLDFGIALHVFGDTYSHSYGSDGSVLKTGGPTYANIRGHAWDGPVPDNIYKRNHVYYDYAKKLYELFCAKALAMKPRVPWGPPNSPVLTKHDDYQECLMGWLTILRSKYEQTRTEEDDVVEQGAIYYACRDLTTKTGFPFRPFDIACQPLNTAMSDPAFRDALKSHGEGQVRRTITDLAARFYARSGD